MTQAEIEKRILELKGIQSDFFKMKKDTRAGKATDDLAAARTELADLKAKAKKIYRG